MMNSENTNQHRCVSYNRNDCTVYGFQRRAQQEEASVLFMTAANTAEPIKYSLKKRNKASAFASPLLGFTPWTSLCVSGSDKDRFHQSRSRSLTDKRSASTVAQKHIWRHIYNKKNTFCKSPYWNDCNRLGPSKMKKKYLVGCFIIKSFSLH